MKRKKKKSIIIAACTVGLLTVVLGVTLAYLLDTTSVVNTFTVGNVDIKLDETVVDEDGNPVDEQGNPVDEEHVIRKEEGNEYHLVPGETYLKDPMITVAEGSEESYVRMILTVSNASAVQDLIAENELSDFKDLIAGWDEEVWKYYGYTEDQDANTISFEFRYAETVGGEGEEVALEPLFTHIVVPETATGEELAALYGDPNTTDDDFKMEIQGHAIQIAGFEASAELSAEDAAWAAFDKQR